MPSKYQKFQPEKYKYCTILPDSVGGVNHAKACFWHDKGYSKRLTHRIKKANKSRMTCDWILAKDLFKIYKNNNRPILGFIASTVGFISALIGGYFYDYEWESP